MGLDLSVFGNECRDGFFGCTKFAASLRTKGSRRLRSGLVLVARLPPKLPGQQARARVRPKDQEVGR